MWYCGCISHILCGLWKQFSFFCPIIVPVRSCVCVCSAVLCVTAYRHSQGCTSGKFQCNFPFSRIFVRRVRSFLKMTNSLNVWCSWQMKIAIAGNSGWQRVDGWYVVAFAKYPYRMCFHYTRRIQQAGDSWSSAVDIFLIMDIWLWHHQATILNRVVYVRFLVGSISFYVCIWREYSGYDGTNGFELWLRWYCNIAELENAVQIKQANPCFNGPNMWDERIAFW